TPPTRPLISSRAPELRDCRRVIYIGQIIPEKGVDLLLDAAALLVARGHDVRLDIVGRIDGWVPPAHRGYRERLMARADSADLKGRVRIRGFREDVPQLLAAGAFHFCPSRK